MAPDVNTAAEMGRRRLEQIPAGTELLREVRYLHADDVADITDDELANAGRWLRAAAHSALEGARNLDRILRQRTQGATRP